MKFIFKVPKRSYLLLLESREERMKVRQFLIIFAEKPSHWKRKKSILCSMSKVPVVERDYNLLYEVG